jgi:hypothetical protein
VLLFFFPALVKAEIRTLASIETESSESFWKNMGWYFPGIYFTDVIRTVKKVEDTSPYWVQTEEEYETINRFIADNTSLLLNNDILAYYGHPNSKSMGILGRYSIEDLDKELTKLAKEYRAVSGGRNIIKAFYIIYGTVWPEGAIGYIGDATLQRYIDYALKNDMLVFIDHQIGRHDPVDSLKKMFHWLRYPNVHLAFDPEWRTSRPMKEIGYVTAEEINRMQKAMEEYMIANDIPGERMLVVHQFNWRMIRNREKVVSTNRRVRLILCSDGHGSPKLKRETYAYNAEATNIPIKSFKHFYGFNLMPDVPLMTPRDVYNLNPRPYLIMYQ